MAQLLEYRLVHLEIECYMAQLLDHHLEGVSCVGSSPTQDSFVTGQCAMIICTYTDHVTI